MLLVAPGLLFELLRERRRPSLTETGFREASRVALTSFLFTASGILTVVIVRLAAPALVVDLSAFLADQRGYLRRNYGLLARTVSIEVLAAFAFVLIFNELLARRPPRRSSSPYSTWWVIFEEDRRIAEIEAKQALRVVASVLTKSGARYSGVVGAYSRESDITAREIVLTAPAYGGPPGARVLTRYDRWEHLVLPASEIALLTYRYEPESSG